MRSLRVAAAWNAARNFASNKHGNFGLMTAAMTPLLIAGIGLALDFSEGVAIKSRLTNAADSAVLAGLHLGAEAKREGKENWRSIAEEEAVRNFDAQLGKLDPVAVQFRPTFSSRAHVLTGTAQYVYQQQTRFMRLFGAPTVEISGAPRASISLDSYVDVTFVVDNSASMGIGATLSDRNIMNNANGNCAFACHQASSTGGLVFTPPAVHKLGAKLRIDVVREAIQNAIDKMTARATKAGQVRFSVYTFSHIYETLLAPVTDKTKALAGVAKLDIAKGSVSALNYGDTRITPALINIANIIKARGGNGSGMSTSNRKNFVVFFSDGVEDSTAFQTRTGNNIGLPAYWQNILGAATVPNFSWWDTSKGPDWVDHPKVKFDGVGYMQPFPQDGCDALKQSGSTVLTAQIKYETASIIQRAVDVKKIKIIKDNASDILEAFSKCASDPTMTYQAVTSSDITNMFDKIVDEIVPAAPLRLTN